MPIAPIDRLPADVRQLVEATMKLLASYMPGTDEITMQVGRNCVATLKFTGGPITRDVIEDTLAHLAFYKKYFPKASEDDGALDSPEKILNAMADKWDLHRKMMALDAPSVPE